MPTSPDTGSSLCRLYLVTPPQFDPVAFAADLAPVLDAGDVACLQIRVKHPQDTPAHDDDIRRTVNTLMPVVRRYPVAMILNDRPDLAHELGTDGVHVGQQDISCKQARKIVGSECSVGVTCHNSRHLAMVAGEDGADYVAFGAFFPTATKQAKTRATLDLLRQWQEDMLIPCVAIGGITPENARPLVEAGADFLAVSHGVWGYAHGPAVAVAAFNHLFSEIAS
ncbi:MAG: thiamine phosphate synthase [Parvularculales bacterium]